MRCPQWVEFQGNCAQCKRCGATSQFVFMRGWVTSAYGQTKDYTFWRWYKGFKRAHRACASRA